MPVTGRYVTIPPQLQSSQPHDATRAMAIQAKASAASTKLTELQSNSTLMTQCAAIDGEIMTNATCTQQFLLQKFVDFAANETLVSQAVNNDMTKTAEVQLKASAAASKLQQLQSNATLQAACPAVFMADECKMLVALKRFADFGMNSTKLEKVTMGNETKITSIKAAAGVAEMQVMMLEANKEATQKATSMTMDSNSKSSKSAASINSMSLSAFVYGGC
ncbi:hypothetical protein DID88_001963 [Monilinia fructigena]|uniref:Uncharacterized protein n=1 Tax=Monilinia fructigena TaxID=38457 RepID=A0A395IW19_9HELO|nr:hypothetical protein DID88_001963 [Monilinia fructigena]